MEVKYRIPVQPWRMTRASRTRDQWRHEPLPWAGVEKFKERCYEWPRRYTKTTDDLQPQGLGGLACTGTRPTQVTTSPVRPSDRKSGILSIARGMSILPSFRNRPYYARVDTRYVGDVEENETVLGDRVWSTPESGRVSLNQVCMGGNK